MLLSCVFSLSKMFLTMIKFKLVHKFTSVNCAFHVVACPDNFWERVSKSASETKRNITHYLTHSLLYLGYCMVCSPFQLFVFICVTSAGVNVFPTAQFIYYKLVSLLLLPLLSVTHWASYFSYIADTAVHLPKFSASLSLGMAWRPYPWGGLRWSTSMLTTLYEM